MKKSITVFLALLLCLCLAACTGGTSADVSLYDLNKAMSSATDKFDTMKYASAADGNEVDTFSHISKMDYGKVKDFCIYYAENGTGNADEIAVINVKNKSDVSEAAASLNAHLEERKSLYATYDTSQIPKLEKGKVVTYGSVAALIVADDTQKIENAFYEFFK